nr:dTDP-4-dehydrorhamnose reductase [uncultured Anaeromusa sp.]
MKVLVTGAGGQLGYDVVKQLQARLIECKGVDLTDFDITNAQATGAYIKEYRPDVVIHCSAYTAVDKAEEEPEKCWDVNVEGTENIAKVCRDIDAKMIYISTDYVFPGTGEHFHEVDDETGPLSIYGKTKLAGEEAVQKWLQKYYIVRISWIFGKNGNNFVETMLRLGREREELSVVCDQIGSPTYTADLAPLLCDMAASDKYGIYHATNEGICSWAEFAEEIFKLAGMKTRVKPITTAEYPTKAKRPFNSRLSKKCLDESNLSRLPIWQDALQRYLKEGF